MFGRKKEQYIQQRHTSLSDFDESNQRKSGEEKVNDDSITEDLITADDWEITESETERITFSRRMGVILRRLKKWFFRPCSQGDYYIGFVFSLMLFFVLLGLVLLPGFLLDAKVAFPSWGYYFMALVSLIIYEILAVQACRRSFAFKIIEEHPKVKHYLTMSVLIYLPLLSFLLPYIMYLLLICFFVLLFIPSRKREE